MYPQDEKYNWQGVDRRVSELTNKEVLEIYIFKQIAPFLTFITKYFPFSLLWQDRRFHHKFKEVSEKDDLIIVTAKQKNFWFKFLYFESDEKFLRLIGKFIPLKEGLKEEELLRYFEKTFSNEDIYINKLDDETFKISFVRK